MKIVAEKSKYHRFALYYEYTPDRVAFCKQLKESFGWQQFSFEALGEVKRWVFSNSLLVPVIAERFPEAQIEPQVVAVVKHEQHWAREQQIKNEKIDEIKTKKDTNFTVTGLKKDLYPYQKVGVEFLVESGGRAIIADAPGLGKTAQALGYMKHCGFKRTLVVCPASVKFAWEGEVKKWTGFSSIVIDSKTDLSKIDAKIAVWIINYDVLKKHYAQLSKIRFDCIIGDEAQYCFPAGTMIKTSSGEKDIREIVEKRIPLYVASYNLLNAEIEYKRVIGYQKNEQIMPLVRVTHEGGSFTATGNHKVYANNQWKETLLLREGDCLYTLPEDFCDLPQGEKHTETLQQKMRRPLAEFTSTNKSSNKWAQSPSNNNFMSVVREKTDADGFADKKRTYSEVLWEILFSKVEKYSAVGNSKFTSSDKKSSGVQEGQEGPEKQRTYEKENDGSCFQEKNPGRVEEVEERKSNLPPPWWERIFNRAPKKTSRVNGDEDGICNKNKEGPRGILIHSDTLQSGSCFPQQENSSRSRWKFPFVKKVEIFRQKKNRDFRISRVVSVEILEQGSNGEPGGNRPQNSYVYNIEVEGNNNYYANGVLVSNCKSTAAIRTKVFRQISREIGSTILLSGTPLLSRPSELFSLLNIIDPKTWNNWYEFARKYCDMRQTRWGVDTSGTSNIEELHARIRRYFIRRDKTEVLKELPPKTFIDMPIKLEGAVAREYDSAASDLAQYLRQYAGKQPPEIAKALNAEKLMQLNVLRQICAKGKVDIAIELIESIIDAGEKVLVFSSFVEPLEMLKARFGDAAVMITGKTAVEDRGDIVDAFQKDKNIMVFLGGYKSAGTGITLTAAQNFVGIDFPWNPADLQQSIDRLHRPGQVAESVNIYQLAAINTIDEDMRSILEHKQGIFEQVIEGKVGDKVATETMDLAVKRVLANH